MREIINKLNKYEIKIRKAVNSHLNGNFSSIFKGTGLEFSDLRTYQYGDDVRAIDWITTAKGHGAYVKIFKEEKEQTVFFMLDVSGSQDIGKEGSLKIDTAKELCGVLTLSAIKEASQVGLYCFSDQKELYIKPESGMKQAYKIISGIFRLKPVSLKTHLADAISFTLNILKRKSVIILISDFLDQDYEHGIKALARKHDLVVLHIFDKREVSLPSLGIVPVYDKEAGKTQWINTYSGIFKREMKDLFEENRSKLEKLCKQNKANYLSVESGSDYVNSLISLFRYRK
ncbi:MAG: DUF58 domain-containing protein [Cytophagaceae bacterium]|nr:DUF58 domain-containing protein [Cytophagaceae bacterium]MBK9508601.1 DUF58 domain-containing protein [Cytophagaceae bacterium]MBK9935376.1 DUF58 domain-containing protein [Cytophagaceae bacterium]MBL0301818.1 DUF58 domain-containing protein [Cytophagaceae bacterium]MBL0324644.1 DUF58 domain-containing protein [Cytophagaceae bacterium]